MSTAAVVPEPKVREAPTARKNTSHGTSLPPDPASGSTAAAVGVPHSGTWKLTWGSREASLAFTVTVWSPAGIVSGTRWKGVPTEAWNATEPSLAFSAPRKVFSGKR